MESHYKIVKSKYNRGCVIFARDTTEAVRWFDSTERRHVWNATPKRRYSEYREILYGRWTAGVLGLSWNEPVTVENKLMTSRRHYGFPSFHTCASLLAFTMIYSMIYLWRCICILSIWELGIIYNLRLKSAFQPEIVFIASRNYTKFAFCIIGIVFVE